MHQSWHLPDSRIEHLCGALQPKGKASVTGEAIREPRSGEATRARCHGIPAEVEDRGIAAASLSSGCERQENPPHHWERSDGKQDGYDRGVYPPRRRKARESMKRHARQSRSGIGPGWFGPSPRLGRRAASCCSAESIRTGVRSDATFIRHAGRSVMSNGAATCATTSLVGSSSASRSVCIMALVRSCAPTRALDRMGRRSVCGGKLVRKQPLGPDPWVPADSRKGLGVLDPALEAARGRIGLRNFEKVHIVVLPEPNDLAFMLGEGGDLLVNAVGDVDVVLRLRVEVADGGGAEYLGHGLERRQRPDVHMRNRGDEGRREDQLEGGSMIRVVVVGRMGDDDVGLKPPEKLDHPRALLDPGGQVLVVVAQALVLRADHPCPLRGLGKANPAQLFGHDLEVALVPIGRRRHEDEVARTGEVRQRASRHELQVIGMRSDAQHSNLLLLHSRPPVGSRGPVS